MLALFVFAPLADAKPPFWDDQVNNAGRFKVLSEFNGAAVFDKETGLVWERSPSTTDRTWFQTLSNCYNKNVGGRKGWRLPTIEELASLVDTSQPAPKLPAGHPFANVQSSRYWSATTSTLLGTGDHAWGVDFNSGGVNDADGAGKSIDFFVWCVRGGQGIDGVQQ